MSSSRRLIDALAAGEAAGGELQPVTSAALMIAHEQSFPCVDLRAEGHVVRAVDPDRATRPPNL